MTESRSAPAARVIAQRIGLEAPQAELADRVMRAARAEGMRASGIPGLDLIRFDQPSRPLPTVCEPSLCVVVQGRKQTRLAGETYTYDALHYLVVSMSLPVVGQVIEASPERPYLCLRFEMQPAVVHELQQQIGVRSAAAAPARRALYLARSSAPLLDAVLRLVRLMDTPQDAAVLAPLALREIHYRALTGELGQHLLDLCSVEGTAQRIARAIDLIKRRYAEPLRIEELAAAAHMSSSALHHRFKAVTAMSPLQFQKQLRLQEARRLMLLEGLEAAAAGHRVGYESPSQFSREYRRLFGAPPRQEIELARLGQRVADG